MWTLDTSNWYTGTGSSSYNFSYTTGALTNGVMQICVNFANTVNITALTYNGAAAVQVGTTITDGSSVKMAFYYVLAPSSGTHNISITLSGSGGVDLAASTYSGCNQSRPVDAYYCTWDGATTNTQNYSKSLTTFTNGALVVWQADNFSGDTGIVGTGGTTVLESYPGGAGNFGTTLAVETATTAGSTTLTMQASSGPQGDWYGNILVAFVPADVELTDNLLEYWTLNNTLNGSLAAINLGQTGSSAGYEAGIIGNSMRYDGTANVYNTVAYTPAIPSGTVNLWFYRIGNGSGTSWRLFAKTQAGVTDVFWIKADNQGKRMHIGIQDASIYQAGSDQFADNTWYMVTVTWDGHNIVSYLNGSSVNNSSSTNTVQSNSQNFTIGGWGGNNSEQANGREDEIGFWTRALTPVEVNQLYNGGAGLTYPFILPEGGYLPMMHNLQVIGGLM